MNKIICLFVLVLFSLQALAGKRDIPTLTIKNTSVRKVGNTVSVSFDIEKQKFPSNHKVIITPILYSNPNQSKTLPSTTVVGRKRDLSDQRSGDTSGNRHTVSRRSHDVIPYSAIIPFEAWMGEVSLSVLQSSDGCGCRNNYPSETIAEGKLLYYDIAPLFNAKKSAYEFTELEQYDLENPFLHAIEEYPRRYEVLKTDREKNASKIAFKVGSSIIDPEYSDNAQTLSAITKALEVIDNDPNASLKHIVITGCASPEGSLALNTRLGQARAEAVKRFIMKEAKESGNSLFELYNGREDWEGLHEMVLNSDMSEKAEVIEIIDYYTIEQEIRKTRLKRFNGGAPYKYMLEHFYPALRTGGYIQAYYESDRRGSFSIPVADAKNRTVWIDPNSPSNRCITTINKAIDDIIAHHFDEALMGLVEFKDDPRTWNYIGVCHMMKGDYNSADIYFRKATDNGDPDAPENLEQTGYARSVEK